MTLKLKSTILLTGAGFTANFGGILAKEMWSKILNNTKINLLPDVKKLLMKNFDFEDVYSTFNNDENISDQDKSLFQEVILDSYGSMDNALKLFCDTGFTQYNICMRSVTKFLGLFTGVAEETGVHFTLNQDLLMERACQKIPLGFHTPAYSDYVQSINSKIINSESVVRLPDIFAIQDFKDKRLSSVGDSCYIKLHGSQGWESVHGKKQMVIGTNKFSDIQKEPLLSWYFDIFRQSIMRPGIELFVVGYSFRDKHVNDLLLEAINEHDLKIYIISPEDPSKFRDRMEGRPEQRHVVWQEQADTSNFKIWQAVNGYFPYLLKDIFPEDHSETHIYRDIKDIILS